MNGITNVVITHPRALQLEVQLIKIHIEKLPEGAYLATSNEIQGLVAQGRTVTETLEIARDIARKLLEAQNSVIVQTP